MFLAPTPTLNGTVRPLKNGKAGVFQTLKAMRQLVNAARLDPQLRQVATSAVFLKPQKDEFAEVSTLFALVQQQIRYTGDVNNVETLQTPQITLASRIGDCDDMTTLLCTLFECIGYPTRFVVAGYNGSLDFAHVYCQVYAVGQWIDCDATEPYAIGWAGPNPSVIFYEAI
jgi:transglutaminase-like putative cysteine protease